MTENDWKKGKISRWKGQNKVELEVNFQNQSKFNRRDSEKINFRVKIIEGERPDKDYMVLYKKVGQDSIILKDYFDYYYEYFNNIVPDLHLHEEEYNNYCDTALEYAKKLEECKLSTSQIRKAYSQLMQSKNMGDIVLLRPQFAYAAGKSQAQGVKSFMMLLDSLVQKIKDNDVQKIQNIKKFAETMVAYLKFVGAKDN